MKLYTYFRSSAAYRVRLALALKGLPYVSQPINLASGEQRNRDFLTLNPQGLVPALELDAGDVISQSVAILEWLEECHPNPPLYPADPLARARHRSLCMHISCDIHPLNNLRVLRYLSQELTLEQSARDSWYAHWIHQGFEAIERAVNDFTGPFSLRERPGMLEVMLVPQVYNARRFNVDLQNYPAIEALDARCEGLEAFVISHPSKQADAPPN